jgi:alkanesulfonate monooxygenase SsuD/methylene tetrahydromethanopterin reductase-like flavin-dependent oxidoreductase (luciferase family)
MGNGIGVVLDGLGVPVETILEQAEMADKSGAESIWVTQLPNQREGSILLGTIAARTRSAQLGTGIQGLYQRPPVMAAQAALTLDELSGNRVILGLGVGHRLLGEWMAGGRYTPSPDAMREYLSVAMSLIRQGEVNVTGRWYSGHASYSPPRRSAMPVYLGVTGPRMLELAAELADGVVLWLVTPDYLRNTVMPRLRAGWARRDGHHRDFEVVVQLYVKIAADVQYCNDKFRAILAGYARMENWKRHLLNAGFQLGASPGSIDDPMIAEMAPIGSVEHVRARIAAYRQAGATQVVICGMSADDFVPTLDALI